MSYNIRLLSIFLLLKSITIYNMEPIVTEPEQTDDSQEFQDCKQVDFRQKLAGKSLSEQFRELRKQFEEFKKRNEQLQRELKHLKELVNKNTLKPQLAGWTITPINNSFKDIHKLRYQVKKNRNKEELIPENTTIDNRTYTNRPIGKKS